MNIWKQIILQKASRKFSFCRFCVNISLRKVWMCRSQARLLGLDWSDAVSALVASVWPSGFLTVLYTLLFYSLSVTISFNWRAFEYWVYWRVFYPIRLRKSNFIAYYSTFYYTVLKCVYTNNIYCDETNNSRALWLQCYTKL